MKTRFRFSHRSGETLHWVALTPCNPGDSRHEHVRCDRRWFWRTEHKTEEVAA